jgi:hypothetical protein
MPVAALVLQTPCTAPPAPSGRRRESCCRPGRSHRSRPHSSAPTRPVSTDGRALAHRQFVQSRLRKSSTSSLSGAVDEG